MTTKSQRQDTDDNDHDGDLLSLLFDDDDGDRHDASTT